MRYGNNILSRNICLGLIAHVDSGKTTLSEGLLDAAGMIRKKGRVDHGDTFLDFYKEERKRGLTIFSKEAIIRPQNGLSDGDITSADNSKIKSLTLIDTPGHPEFQAETERALMVMDYCVMILSAPDLVRQEDRDLWDLIGAYEVPTFIFLNKTDRPCEEKDVILGELKCAFCQDGFVDFESIVSVGKGDKGDINFLKEGMIPASLLEDIASLDEHIMDEYLKNSHIETSDIKKLINERRLFPCLFGSALKNRGIDELLYLISNYTLPKVYPDHPSALCYKIAMDAKKKRITYAKLTGGVLHPKDVLFCADESGNLVGEKVDQIFFPNGQELKQTREIHPGEIAALSGLVVPSEGSGPGYEAKSNRYKRLKKATFKTRLKAPEGADMYNLFLKISELAVEFPEVEIAYDKEYDEINLCITGKLQAEVFKSLMKERYEADIDFMDTDELNALDQKRKIEEALLLEALKEENDTVSWENTDEGDSASDSAGKREESKKREDLLGAGLKKDEELEEIFNSTLSRNRRERGDKYTKDRALSSRRMRKPDDFARPYVKTPDPKDSYLLVDGYNIIFASRELSTLAKENLDSARSLLSDILANYQAYRGMTLILVFDAYKLPGRQVSVEKYHDIYIVYTKEAQTADAYIEETVHEISRDRYVTVVTNDSLEQTITFGAGAYRMTANELMADIRTSNEDMYEKYMSRTDKLENRIKLDEQ